jgi:hypothetical protein
MRSMVGGVPLRLAPSFRIVRHIDAPSTAFGGPPPPQAGEDHTLQPEALLDRVEAGLAVEGGHAGEPAFPRRRVGL